ncbi:MAG: ribosome-associated translation inhibitor RaiA [Candidatus Marinimicrobia bacterium]|nr:ribosome-associated translation inhibitor RaiA [Candidatus Neomarinimicrobiota bacterium]RKY61212.1 MAG: ribosome-associated translation inhibitor RaiA [Candidatus Neomarinimicrobiota bacterium]
MKVEITSRHFDASPKVREYVIGELQKLDKFDHLINSCKVILEKSKEGNFAEITLHVSGKDLVSSESSDDIIKSIDFAVEKMERQLKKFKEKRYSH